MRHTSKERERSYRSAESCCCGKLHCCSRGRKANGTADTEHPRKRGQGSAQDGFCLVSYWRSDSFSPSPGSRSLIKPSVCVTHSKCMSPKLLMPSRSWIISCGPRMPTVGHIFCASLLHLADGSGIAPQAVSQEDDKDNGMSAMDRRALGLWGEKHTWLEWGLQHLDAFPFPVSKPEENPVAVRRQLPVRDNQKWALVEELQHL